MNDGIPRSFYLHHAANRVNRMLLYTTLGTNDLTRAVHFYDAIFAVLDHPHLPDWGDGWACWGKDLDAGFSFCLCPPFDGKAASTGNGTMTTFGATSAAQVRSFHSAGIANGGADAGAPGTRKVSGPDFYVAYLLDPDGHKLACVYPNYDPTI